ncbi:MAG TPA: hypothetical protein PK052_04840 [Anaerohalosphaeraceae bacterium]|nr:hypothetical protein [Phycisphaerae bacterium]HOL31288.1 hypothetical protein [Anaerohalosphaeraceae bacterium]HOM76084.1 hypothetical protein [Anaerohalosphaeraceae bacterium]HPC64800.1 hypothetical protein [Anaerohalosphaeraceae bacterium]HPO70037.1 hypothetical protein [Anaerohalosphaeraceae bacterium]
MIKQTNKIYSAVIVGLVLAAAAAAGLIAFFLFDASGSQIKPAPEYSYNIEQYAKIDPELILYRQTGDTLQLRFEKCSAIAVDAVRRMYIAGDQKIAVYDAQHSIQREIELKDEPTCLHIDFDGGLIAGLKNHLVFLDTEGQTRNQWPAPAENALLTSIAADRDNIFAADAVNKLVWRFSRTGEVQNQIGRKDAAANIPGIVVPSPYFDIAAYPDGLLRVVNPGRHWIEAYTADGHRQWYWGRAGVDIEGFSGCCNPVALAVLPDGGFVTCEKGLVRVKVYSAEGQFIGVAAGPEQLGWSEPLRICTTAEECKSKGFDVAVDSDGRIYVLNTVNNTVKIFEKK